MCKVETRRSGYSEPRKRKLRTSDHTLMPGNITFNSTYFEHCIGGRQRAALNAYTGVNTFADWSCDYCPHGQKRFFRDHVLPARFSVDCHRQHRRVPIFRPMMQNGKRYGKRARKLSHLNGQRSMCCRCSHTLPGPYTWATSEFTLFLMSLRATIE